MSKTIVRFITALAFVGSFGAGAIGGATQSAFAAPGPNLSTSTMSVNPTGTLNPDSSAGYTVTINNTGNAAATGVTYTDTPDGNETLSGTYQSTPIAQNYT